MSSNMQVLRKVVEQLPPACAADQSISWLGARDMLQSINISILSQTTPIDDRVKGCMQLVARVGAVAVLHFLSRIGIIYNGAAAFGKLGMGIVGHFQQGAQEDVVKNLKDGFVHASLATYDFAVAFLLASPVGLLADAVFIFFPQHAQAAHKFIFDPADFITKSEPSKTVSEGADSAEDTPSASSEDETSEQPLPPPPAKKTCLVHQLATGLTQRIVPPKVAAAPPPPSPSRFEQLLSFIPFLKSKPTKPPESEGGKKPDLS